MVSIYAGCDMTHVVSFNLRNKKTNAKKYLIINNIKICDF